VSKIKKLDRSVRLFVEDNGFEPLTLPPPMLLKKLVRAGCSSLPIAIGRANPKIKKAIRVYE
jgi:hypothetical protein